MTIQTMTRGFGRTPCTLGGMGGGCGWDETGTIENLEHLDDTPLSHLSGPASLGGVGDPTTVIVKTDPGIGTYVISLLALAGAGASAYHGYMRNNSVGWGAVWGLAGALVPYITVPVAYGQGFAKPAKGVRSGNPVTRATHRDGTRDRRYAIRQEWCGYPEKRHVARFAGEWVGQSKTHAGAEKLIKRHQVKRGMK